MCNAPDEFRCAIDGQLMMDPVKTPQAQNAVLSRLECAPGDDPKDSVFEPCALARASSSSAPVWRTCLERPLLPAHVADARLPMRLGS